MVRGNAFFQTPKSNGFCDSMQKPFQSHGDQSSNADHKKTDKTQQKAASGDPQIFNPLPQKHADLPVQQRITLIDAINT